MACTSSNLTGEAAAAGALAGAEREDQAARAARHGVGLGARLVAELPR